MSSLGRPFIFLLFCLFPPGWADQGSLYAQYDQVWVFGHHAGLDFNGSYPKAIESVITGFGEGSASVTDQNGQLLFYTEGTVVWDKNGKVMPGGENLIPLNSVNEHTTTSSTCQGAIIIPQPGTAHKYYVFSLTSIEQGGNAGRLYYSVVDMQLNNGLGGIDVYEKGVFLDSGLKEQMTSIVGEKCNIWLIVRSTDNVFKAYSVSGSGVNRMPRQSAVGEGNKGVTLTGQMVASPDNRKLVTAYMEGYTGFYGGVDLFDFDPATGVVSHPVKLDSVSACYGVAFSPDNSKVYASFYNKRYLSQFDLNSAVPAATHTLIADLIAPSNLKLGPDGKIYAGSTASATQQSMSVINFPNLSGTACGFSPDTLPLIPGTRKSWGLSNVINCVTKTEGRTVTIQKESPCWFSPEDGYALAVDAGGWDYTWDDGSTGKSRKVYAPGRYWVTYYTAPCQLHTDTFMFSIPYGMLPRITIDASCAKTGSGKARAITYPGDAMAYQYIWRNDREDILSTADTLDRVPAGWYSLQVTTANCDTMLWVEIPELTGQVSFSVDSLVCMGDTIWFHNTSDSYYTHFSWTIDNGLFSDAVQPYYLADRQGQFPIQLVGTGRFCRDTTVQFVTVDPLVQNGFAASSDSICVGQELTLTIQQMDFTLLAQTWLVGEVRYHHDLKENMRVHAFDKSGLHPITLLSVPRICPAYEFTDTVFVVALPVIDLGNDSLLCLQGSPIILENKHALSAVRYLWSTGDTTRSIRVKHPGIYTLKLYTLSLGCVSVEEMEIKKDCYVDVPNSFSPNGDGHNDFFLPRAILSRGLSYFRMQVFNRWGQVVFDTKNADGRGWDGQWNGRAQPMGVYVYRIEVGPGDLSETYTGNVTLLR